MTTFGDGYQTLTDPRFLYDETDPRDYADQYHAWQLTHDTVTCDITNYPGNAEERGTAKPTYRVVRKRDR
jgi:hypothetical protein